MKTLNDTLYELEVQCAEMSSELGKLRRKLADARDQWPDHQIVTEGVHWHTRDEVAPEGPIWASNGIGVWLIQGRGRPIPDGATSVLYWTEALIPAAPEVGNDPN